MLPQQVITAMHEAQAIAVRNWFRDHVEGFRQADGKMHPALELKVGHSARVAALCHAIAQDSRWEREDVIAGEVTGWLHDVGRFTQWQRHETYRDEISEDHAALGKEIVLQKGVLDHEDAQERSFIVDAIALHNRRQLPSSASPDSLRFCRLVRDADKLDILELSYHGWFDGSLGEMQPHLSHAREVSPALLAEVREHHRSSYSNMKTLSDFLLACVSWAYDFNHGATARMVRDQGMFTRLWPLLPDSPDVREFLRQADTQVHSLASSE
jgi:hypothetical protein